MNASRVLTALILTAIACACLELEGQRVRLRYDPAGDVLTALVLYDGIHDSGSDENGKGTEQLQAALREGQVMLLDWPLHYRPEALRAWLAEAPLGWILEWPDAGADPEWHKRLLVHLALANIEVRTLARTEDASGHQGAAQWITIRRASELLAAFNRVLDATFLERWGSGESAEDPQWQAIVSSAREGGHWLRFEGTSLAFEMPVHPAAWARWKLDFLRGLTGQHNNADDVGMLTMLSAGVSLEEGAHSVRFRLGSAERAPSLSYTVHPEYEPSLEPLLRELLPHALDEWIAPAPGAAPLEPLGDDVAAMIPLETRLLARARALVRDVSADAVSGQRAQATFAALSATWNREVGLPRVPAPGALVDPRQRADFLEAFQAWYAAARALPLTNP